MHGSRTKRMGRLGVGLAAAALGALALASGASARPFSSTGSFVIGDQSANVGSTVTFWGAQWWKDNDLSGGTAPAAFKGFADTAAPVCGETWTTRPGNSSFPPETVGPVDPQTGWVRMVVSSQITKDGPVISGDTAKVVLVAVDPGYGPNPGHAGTGTVMQEVCPGGGLPS
jgi:hypothetical protein